MSKKCKICGDKFGWFVTKYKCVESVEEIFVVTVERTDPIMAEKYAKNVIRS